MNLPGFPKGGNEQPQVNSWSVPASVLESRPVDLVLPLSTKERPPGEFKKLWSVPGGKKAKIFLFLSLFLRLLSKTVMNFSLISEVFSNSFKWTGY